MLEGWAVTVLRQLSTIRRSQRGITLKNIAREIIYRQQASQTQFIHVYGYALAEKGKKYDKSAKKQADSHTRNGGMSPSGSLYPYGSTSACLREHNRGDTEVRDYPDSDGRAGMYLACLSCENAQRV